MTFFIDSNIFLRVLAKEDEKTFEECRNLLTKIKNSSSGHEFITGSVVIAEVAWTLISYYKSPKDIVVRGIDSVFGTKGISFSDTYDLKNAVKIYSRYNIKFIDALIASIPQIDNKKWTVISYDRDFDKIGTVRKEPKPVIELLSN